MNNHRTTNRLEKQQMDTMLSAEAISRIAEKFDWDQIAGGVVNEAENLYLAEFERIKPHDEKIMLLFHGGDIVAATIKHGDNIGQAPENKTPAEMFTMVVTAMATI